MKNKTQKYPCGQCCKNIGKSCQAVLCTGICTQWYHLKCTTLSLGEFNNMTKTKKRWVCNTCLSVDVTFGLEDETVEIDNDVKKELETQSEIIKTLNDDLKQANEEIQLLKSHNLQLETMVLKKEETIITLERQLNLLSTKTSDPSTGRTKKVELQHSLPRLHSTPLSIDGTKNRTWSPEQHKHESFALAVKGKKTSSLKYAKKNKHIDSSFLYNRFEVLGVEEEKKSDNIAVITNVEDHTKAKDKRKKMLVCADSHGRDLALHLNESQKTHEAVGFVRPGGRTKQILGNENVEKANLNKEDVLVIICGTNDVARNEANEVVDGITTILDKFKQTNVLLVNLPNRYDLEDWSCVNREVKRTNQRLQGLSEKYSNLMIVDVNKAERHLHTRQGLHLNHRGKKWLAGKIVEAVAAKKKPVSLNTQNDEQPPPPGTESLSGNASPLTQGKNP